MNAINNTILANPLSAGCPSATSAGASSQTSVGCYLAAVPGASIADFANHGLDSGGQYLGGAPASLFGLTPDTGAAFAGVNPLVGRNTMFFPAGRSLYSGVQVSLRSQITSPVRGVRGGSLQISYSHSSFRSNVPEGDSDMDLLPLAADFNHPIAFFGSAAEDRKNQVTIASVLDVPYGARLGFIAQFASPLPQTLFIPASDGVGGEIFRSDVTGDGAFGGQSQTGASSYGDILPGTNIGSFGRGVKADGLNTLIDTYNANFGNQLDSRRPDPGQCRLAVAIANDSAGCGYPAIGAGPCRKYRSGLAEDLRCNAIAPPQVGRPIRSGAQRLRIQRSQLRQL